MRYNMKRVKIRTVTTGVVLSRGAPRPEWRTVLERAAEFNKAAVGAYEAAGFVVQTSRIATNPFEEYVDASDRVAALDAFSFIDAVLLEVCGCCIGGSGGRGGAPRVPGCRTMHCALASSNHQLTTLQRRMRA